LILARCQGFGAFGSQNAAGMVGGTVLVGTLEKYNGYAWSLDAVLISPRRESQAAGTQNAGLLVGGYIEALSALTEEYNGVSWSTSGDLIGARISAAGDGTQNAAWVAIGTGGTTNVAASGSMEEYNGSTWSAGGNLTIARATGGAGAGTQNAAMVISGCISSYTTATEEYDGVSWSAGAAVGTGRKQSGGAGSQQAALFVAGVGGKQLTEEYQKTHSGATYLLTKKIKAQE